MNVVNQVTILNANMRIRVPGTAVRYTSRYSSTAYSEALLGSNLSTAFCMVIQSKELSNYKLVCVHDNNLQYFLSKTRTSSEYS